MHKLTGAAHYEIFGQDFAAVDEALHNLAEAADQFDDLLEDEKRQLLYSNIPMAPQIADDFFEAARDCLDWIRLIKGPKEAAATAKVVRAAHVALSMQLARGRIHDDPAIAVVRAKTWAVESEATAIIHDAAADLSHREIFSLIIDVQRYVFAGGLLQPTLKAILEEDNARMLSGPSQPKANAPFHMPDFGPSQSIH